MGEGAACRDVGVEVGGEELGDQVYRGLSLKILNELNYV